MPSIAPRGDPSIIPNLKFNYYPPTDQSPENHVIHAIDQNSGSTWPIGTLKLASAAHAERFGDPNNMINWIGVDPAYQGKGIAKQMLLHAQSLGLDPVHAYPEDLKPDGKKFVKNTPEFGQGIPWYARPDDHKTDPDYFRTPPGKLYRGGSVWQDTPTRKLDFKYQPIIDRETQEPLHRVTALINGKRAGILDMYHEDGMFGDPGEIKAIDVHPKVRRQGIGTAMLMYARDTIGLPVHHSEGLTPDGREFATSLPQFDQ